MQSITHYQQLSKSIPSSVWGILFMLANSIALSVLDISAKALRHHGFSSGLIVFIYKFCLLCILLPWIMSEGTKYLKTKNIWMHLFRGLGGTIGAMFFFHGLKHIQMADAAALENVQYIIILLLGFIFFNEKFSKTKTLATFLGLLGAVIVVKPSLLGLGGPEIIQDNKNYTFTLVAICFWAVNSIIVKVLGKTEHNKTQSFYALLFACIISFPTAFFQWNHISFSGFSLPISPSLVDFSHIIFDWSFVLLFAIMMISWFIHLSAYFNALKSELSVVIPFRYSKLVFSAILGLMLFSESISILSLSGYICIVLSGCLLVHYEVRRKKISH